MASYVDDIQQTESVKLPVSTKQQPIEASCSSYVKGDYTKVGKPIRIFDNDGKMGKPWGIALGKNGIWAVADSTTDCIYILDKQDKLIKEIRGISHPVGLAVDDNNHVYVSDKDYGIQKFDIKANLLARFGGHESANGQLNFPLGITIHNNNVFVAERGNHRISVFHTNGRFSHIIGKAGQMSWPYDVTVTTNNRVAVADRGHHCIYMFTMDGNYVSKFAQKACARGVFSYPFGITADLYGNLLIADYIKHCILIFDKDGNLIHRFGSKGTSGGKFDGPNGIAISPNGNIYISDHDNKRVQIFSYL